MIPYIKVPDLHIGPLPIHPFGILVATGVLVGTALATRRARRLGFDVYKLNTFITWMLVAGFIGGHVLDELFYHWDEAVKHPLSLLTLWTGLSSFGGFIGAVIGGVLWKFFEYRPPRWYVNMASTRIGAVLQPFVSLLILVLFPFFTHRRATSQPILPFADLILSVFPVAWIFGRSGCSVVHDHPGARASADALLAVSYPLPGREAFEPMVKVGPIELIHGGFPRYDLGLLELMFTVILAACFALTWRRRLPTGTYVVVAAFAYAPVRFVMDFLRLPELEGGDTRYASLTPAQWSCTALFCLGLVVLIYMRSLSKRGIDPADELKSTDAEPTVDAKASALEA